MRPLESVDASLHMVEHCFIPAALSSSGSCQRHQCAETDQYSDEQSPIDGGQPASMEVEACRLICIPGHLTPRGTAKQQLIWSVSRPYPGPLGWDSKPGRQRNLVSVGLFQEPVPEGLTLIAGICLKRDKSTLLLSNRFNNKYFPFIYMYKIL